MERTPAEALTSVRWDGVKQTSNRRELLRGSASKLRAGLSGSAGEYRRRYERVVSEYRKRIDRLTR